ncbi:MAG: sce7726 family protein [Bacteroidota bacterium]
MSIKSKMIKDRDIREVLFKTELTRHANVPGTLVIEELGLCQGAARVDIAVLNGHLTGYEIKSEADTLERLTLQRDIYERVLDFVTLVGYTDHLAKVDALVPQWWGIIEVYRNEDDNLQLREVRPPQRNKTQDGLALAQLLWKQEVVDILKGLGQVFPRHFTRAKLWEQLSMAIEIDELSAIVRQTLKQRKNWRVAL